MDKKSNEEKVWTRVVERMAQTANQKQMKSLEGYIKWAKDNDVIKEHVQEEVEKEPWDKSTGNSTAPSIKTVNSYKVG